jgi:hypothetical protein
MFLIHATRVVNMCVDFADVIEITRGWSGSKNENLVFSITDEERSADGFREYPDEVKQRADLHFCHLLDLIK